VCRGAMICRVVRPVPVERGIAGLILRVDAGSVGSGWCVRMDGGARIRSVCDAAAKPRYLTAAEHERIALRGRCAPSARELGRDHSSVLRAARSERVGRLVKEIRCRGGDAQRQAAKRARDAERACLAELEAQAAGPQVAAATTGRVPASAKSTWSKGSIATAAGRSCSPTVGGSAIGPMMGRQRLHAPGD
jgi:hypothetical protein